MITFITNMQQASQVVGDNNTARDAINRWISERGLNFTDAEGFLGTFAVSNVTSNAEVSAASLDDELPDGATLSVYTKAVATGGVKGACC